MKFIIMEILRSITCSAVFIVITMLSMPGICIAEIPAKHLQNVQTPANDEYIPFISENRIWEIFSIEDIHEGFTFRQFAFRGTTVIDNVEYHNLVEIHRFIVKDRYYWQTNEDLVEADIDPNFICYFREADRRVIVRRPATYTYNSIDVYNSVINYIDYYNSDIVLSENDLIDFKSKMGLLPDEILLYDFSTTEGNTAVMDVVFDNTYHIVDNPSSYYNDEIYHYSKKFYLESKASYNNENFSSVIYKFKQPVLGDSTQSKEDEIIEGIGVFNNGYLMFHKEAFVQLSGPLYYFPIHANFNRVMDNDGNVLFDITKYNDENKYNNIPILKEIDRSDSVIYDIYGHQIDKPSTGSIYICNGKKFIAR